MVGIIDTEQKLNDAIDLLKSDNVEARRIAVRLLGRFVNYGKVQFETAIDALTNALTDKDGYVRELSTEAIGKAAKYRVLIPEQTISILRRLMRVDANNSVRDKTEQALIDCGRLQRRTNGSPDQMDLFTWRSMGEAYAMLRRMQRATPKPAACTARSAVVSL